MASTSSKRDRPRRPTFQFCREDHTDSRTRRPAAGSTENLRAGALLPSSREHVRPTRPLMLAWLHDVAQPQLFPNLVLERLPHVHVLLHVHVRLNSTFANCPSPNSPGLRVVRTHSNFAFANSLSPTHHLSAGGTMEAASDVLRLPRLLGRAG